MGRIVNVGWDLATMTYRTANDMVLQAFLVAELFGHHNIEKFSLEGSYRILLMIDRLIFD